MPVVSLRPSADISVTDWETGTGSGSNLYAEIDESSVSSSDYIETEGGTAKFELTNPSAGIVAATMRVRFRKDGDDDANLTVRLLQNNYPTTWNPAGKTSNVALSGGDLIATVGNSGYAGARTVASYSTGKKYAEIEYIGPGPVTLTVGFSNSSYGFADALGNTNNDLGWRYDGRIFLNSTLVDTISAYAPGDTLCLAVDFDNEKFWARPLSDPNWNDDVVSNQNPATNTGGVSFSSLAAGPYYLTFFVYFASGGSFTLNAGQAAYAGVKPAGFTNWSGGEATVAEWEFTDIADTDVDEEVALTAPEFALITDASDLRVEFEASVIEGGASPITFVNSVAVGPAGTTASIDTTGADFLVAVLVNYIYGLDGVVGDNKGNTFTPLTLTAIASGSKTQIFYCANANVGTGHTFSCTSGDFPALSVAAFANVKTSSPHDQEVPNSGSTGTSSTASASTGITPSEDGTLVIAGVGFSAGTVSSIGGGFTIPTGGTVTFGSGSHFGGSLAYLIQTTAAAADPDWTLSSSTDWAARLSSFKVAP